MVLVLIKLISMYSQSMSLHSLFACLQGINFIQNTSFYINYWVFDCPTISSIYNTRVKKQFIFYIFCGSWLLCKTQSRLNKQPKYPWTKNLKNYCILNMVVVTVNCLRKYCCYWYNTCNAIYELSTNVLDILIVV